MPCYGEGVSIENSGTIDFTGGHGDGETCHWTVTCDVGVPTIAISTMDTETNFDYVNVFGSQDLTETPIGRYTGSTIPDPLSGSTSTMVVQFTSDASITADGFSASVSCTGNTPLCSIGDVYVSEAHGSGDPADYIEIVNGGPTCSMQGFTLDDSAAQNDLTFGAVTLQGLGPRGEVRGIWVGFKNGENSFTSGISDSAEEIHLCDPDGNCENVAMASSDPMSAGGSAHCFNPQGTSSACYCSPTPGTPNTACVEPPPPPPDPSSCVTAGATGTPCTADQIYISEAHGTGDPADYIELYNSGETCTLKCWAFDDNAAQNDLVWDDVVIEAGGYWLGYRHGIQDSSGNGDTVSFGSGISGSSENLHLTASDGTVFDFVEMGATPDNGDAHCFDAAGIACYCTPTPGSVNAECTDSSDSSGDNDSSGGSGGSGCIGDVCATVTTVSTEGPGTTYQISLTLSGTALNAYTIFGTPDMPMSIPPSYQEAAPFGANAGGVNAAFLPIMPTAAYDGWLTVGITSGDTAGALGTVGIDWDAWTNNAGLETTDGAIFWMTPDDGPTGDVGPIVVAQFTTAPGWTASFGAQGRTSGTQTGTSDWQSGPFVVSG